MLKEIFEQPESIVNTMRGRMQFDQCKGELPIVLHMYPAHAHVHVP